MDAAERRGERVLCSALTLIATATLRRARYGPSAGGGQALPCPLHTSRPRASPHLGIPVEVARGHAGPRLGWRVARPGGGRRAFLRSATVNRSLLSLSWGFAPARARGSISLSGAPPAPRAFLPVTPPVGRSCLRARKRTNPDPGVSTGCLARRWPGPVNEKRDAAAFPDCDSSGARRTQAPRTTSGHATRRDRTCWVRRFRESRAAG
jgi:hypothetical protein